MPDILIVSGPPGCGKSTAAQALGDRYDRVAHIPVETLRHFVTPTGFVKPGQAGPALDRQVRLAVRNACALARNFVAERFGVIIEDAVTGPEHLAWYIEGLREAGVPVHFIRLMPRLEECERRDAQRRERRVAPGRVRRVYKQIEAAGAFAGATIDNTNLTPEETADRVQALTTAGESLVWAPGAA